MRCLVWVIRKVPTQRCENPDYKADEDIEGNQKLQLKNYRPNCRNYRELERYYNCRRSNICIDSDWVRMSLRPS